MKRNNLILSLSILSAGIALWLLWPSASNTINKSDAHTSEHVHNHHEHSHDHDDHAHEAIVPLSSSQMREFNIATSTAGPGQIAESIFTRGKIIIHPDRLAHILPKIQGVANEARKNIGDEVKEGEILAILMSREMADVKANYLAAHEKLKLASSLLDREKRLSERKVSAEQDYINAKSAYEEAKINLLLATQKLHAFGIEDEEIKSLSSEHNSDLSLHAIRSPINGTVIARHITTGEFIESSAKIYEIADLSTVWVEIGIYPKDLVKVHEGQMIDITFPDGKKAQAKIIYLSPIIQDETITAKATAELENPHSSYRPGTFVKVDVSLGKVNSPVVISKSALQEIEGNQFVFVKVHDGFEKRQVNIGLEDNDNVEIVSGLNTGEDYASSNTFLLKADLKKEEAEHEHR